MIHATPNRVGNRGPDFSWSRADGRQTPVTDFQGPADFCAMPSGDNLNLVVPHLIKGELRLIQLH